MTTFRTFGTTGTTPTSKTQSNYIGPFRSNESNRNAERPFLILYGADTTGGVGKSGKLKQENRLSVQHPESAAKQLTKNG